MAPDGEQYVRFLGVKTVCLQCEGSVSVNLTYRASEKPRLSLREDRIAFRQWNGEACAGPFDLRSGAKVSLYSPENRWLTTCRYPDSR